MDSETLPSLDAALLTPIVRRILGDGDATVADWRVASLGCRVINGITGGLWRVAGTARTGGREVAWSAVLKVLRRVGEGSAANFAPTEEPGHWNYWRREATQTARAATATAQVQPTATATPTDVPIATPTRTPTPRPPTATPTPTRTPQIVAAIKRAAVATC